MVTYLQAHLPNLEQFNWNRCMTVALECAADPTVQYITNNWRESLMLAGLAVAVTGAVAAFFWGMTALCCTFLFFAALSGLGAFISRQVTILQGFEEIATDLRQRNYDLGVIRGDLELRIVAFGGANERLETTNRGLTEQMRRLETQATLLNEQNNLVTQNNRELQAHCAHLRQSNEGLEQQVALLSTQISLIQSSSAKIVEQVSGLQEGNEEFDGHLGGLKENVTILQKLNEGARHMFSEIASQFETHEKGLGEQIRNIGKQFDDLWGSGSVLKHLETLKEVRLQIEEGSKKQEEIREQTQTMLIEYTKLATHSKEMDERIQWINKEFTQVFSEYRIAIGEQGIQTDKLALATQVLETTARGLAQIGTRVLSSSPTKDSEVPTKEIFV